jgi:hypothetical protein
MTETEVLAAYSSPRLRRGELDRIAKKEQLNSLGMAKYPEDRDKILDELYGRPTDPRA